MMVGINKLNPWKEMFKNIKDSVFKTACNFFARVSMVLNCTKGTHIEIESTKN